MPLCSAFLQSYTQQGLVIIERKISASFFPFKQQDQLEIKDSALRDSEMEVRRLKRELDKIDEVASDLEAAANDDAAFFDDDNLSLSESTLSMMKAKSEVFIRCKFHTSGCRYKLPSMQRHEDRDCKYRPARCPSLTCPLRPPFATLLDHIKVSRKRFRAFKQCCSNFCAEDSLRT